MAENDNGRLNFGIGIDLDGLQRGADEAKGVFDGIASEAQAKGADIDRAFGTDAARGFHTLAEAVNATVSQISAMEFGSAEERIGALGQVIQITEDAMEDAAAGLDALRDSSDATAEEVAEAQSAYDSLSASLAAAQGEMMSLAQQYNETTETVRQYTATAEEQESIMVRLLGGTENYNEIMSALPGPVRAAIGAVNGLTGASKAFIATPIGAIIAALVLAIQALTAWFKRSSEGQEAFAKISGYVSGVLNQLMEIVLKVGKAIYSAFTDPKKALDDFVQALKQNVINRFQAVGEMAGAVGKVIKSVFSLNFDDAKEGLGELGNAFLKFETGIDDLSGKVKTWAQGVGDAANESAAISTESRQLELEVSKWQVRKQELDRIKAEASAKMYDTSASAEDRKKALDDYKAALQEEQNMEQKFADKRVELQERRMAITTNSDEDYMELDRLKAQAAAVETQAQQELASLTRRANSINRALGQETKDMVNEGEEREKALVSLGQMEAKLIDANNRTELSRMEEGHAKRMAELRAERDGQMAELEKTAEEFRRLNAEAGVQTQETDTGALGSVSTAGLTETQTEELGRMLKNITDSYGEEEQRLFDDILASVETYGQKRERIEREHGESREKIQKEFIEREKALYDEEGNLRDGVTDENVENLRRQENDALLEIDREYYEASNALAMEELEAGVEELRTAVETAKEELEAAKAEGGDSEKLAAAKKKLTTANKELKTATKNLSSEQKSQQKQQQKGDNDDEKSENALGKLGNAVGKCGDAFEEMGDAIGGSVGDAFTKIGQVTSAVGGFLNSVDQFVTVGIEGMKTASEGGVSAIEAVESASTILAMIGAIMQIAQMIASLFGNGDEAKEEEIQALQERIDDLQWELDNAEAARVRDATGGALSTVSAMYQAALSDAKAANKAGQSYVSMLNEWTQAAGKAKASDVAHEKTVQGIIKTYTNLGYTVDKAIGEDKYKAAGDEVKNYAEQMALIQEQYEKEDSKKKTDQSKLAEYQEQMDEIAENMVDTLNSAVEDIIGGSYEDISKQLGDAFVEAFQAGEDAAEAWGDTVEDIVNDIVKQMLIQQWIEPNIAKIFEEYEKKWFETDDEGNVKYLGNEAVVDSMEAFSAELNGAMDEFAVQWEAVSDAMGWAADSTREAAGNGIASASQESIDELNGRMTAIQGHTYTISENTEVIASATNLILQSVLGIEDSTALILEGIRDTGTDVRSLAADVGDLAVKGIRIR